MANFYEEFSGNLSNWIQSSAAPVDRGWFISGGLLKPEDNVSGKFGLIRYKDIFDVNGHIVVEFNGVDLYNGTDNLIVLRYTDNSNFTYLSIQPGQNDDRGIAIGFNELSQGNPNIELYNSNGDPLSGEIAPNKTVIPQTGRLDITMTNNVYDVVIYDSVDAFVASGSYVDSLNQNINSGYVGFGHTDKWDANINGWDSISAVDSGVVIQPPVIQSFSASDYVVNLGNSTTLGWVVTSGTDVTTVELGSPINATVGLNGTYLETPTVSATYSLSAWNSGGSDYAEFDITVSNTFPIINSFTNDGPISAGSSATLSWDISAGTATSAFINNGIGWIEPYSNTGTVVTPALSIDTEYTLQAYDEDLDISVSSTYVDVQQLPTASLMVSGAPTCSGSPFYLIWDTEHATSAYIDNGIGAVATSGVLEVSASTPTNYVLSAVNGIGIDTDSANAIIYYVTPTAYVGDDVYKVSTDGQPVEVTLDASQSYDPDGLPLSYLWYNNGLYLSSGITYTDDYPVGTTTIDLVVSDICGLSGTDSVNIVVDSKIPPVANADVDKNILNAPGIVQFNGGGSYDPDGFIQSYQWYYNGSLIGTGVIFDYTITTFGKHVFTLVVVDADGLTDSDDVIVVVTEEANPVADAGEDQQFCSFGTIETIDFDGSGSTDSVGSEIVWYEWDLSDFGLPSVSGTVNDMTDISATVSAVPIGEYETILTVSAENGYTDTDVTVVNVFQRPSVNASSVVEYLDYGQSITDVVVSATSNAITPLYSWQYSLSTSALPSYYEGQILELELGEGHYDAYVTVTDLANGCVSNTRQVNIDVLRGVELEIVSFAVDPAIELITGSNTTTDVELSWVVNNATNVWVDGNPVNPVSGTTTSTVSFPGGMVPFTISATNGTQTASQIIYGRYTWVNDPVNPNIPIPIEQCKTRADLIRTYGLDELKYGKDRPINLVNYLPDYIRGTDTEILLGKFEYYLNHMFDGQRNYTWDENEIDVSICTTSACNIYTCCNDISGCSDSTCSGDCNTECGVSLGQYEFSATTSAGFVNVIADTPASSVGEVFVGNACSSMDDKISILDKIFRITEMFDPDLIPAELIQFYAENLGYQAGINRESIGASRKDDAARELEQKRYLRFMIRNLPNWYQIKTTPASIAIMLYSFGIIGDFVYYYTKCYSDLYDKNDTGLCTPEVFPTLEDNSTSGTTITSFVNNTCGVTSALDLDSRTAEEIAATRCCLKKHLANRDEWEKATKNSNGIGTNDWVLTDVDNSSLNEDLTPVNALETNNPGYFSSPHFKLWVDINESTGNYSLDEERQRMTKAAVDAMKPINTVFDGVAVYFKSSPSMIYQNPKRRIRKHIRIISDGTYTS